MKLTKKVLSVFLAILMLSSLMVCASAEEDIITHSIAASGKTIIPSVEYVTTNNKAGIRDYGYNGVKYCIPILSNESVNLGSGSGLNNIYSINVAEAGQYRATVYISRVSSALRADVCVVNNGDVVARTVSSVGTTGVTNAHPVVTPSFNLSAGAQEFNLRVHSVNFDPTKYNDNYLFFYYFELEKIDSSIDPVEISGVAENEIDIENYIFTDQGVTKTDNSAIISANESASFYVDAPIGGEYAFSLKYKAASGTKLYATTNTTDIYKGELIPADGTYLTHTLSIANLNTGINKIDLKSTQNLEIEKIYLIKTSDDSVMTAINNANTEGELKSEIGGLEEYTGIYLSDGAHGIFYQKPVYNRLLKDDYSTVSEFVKEYNDALILEYEKPWVTLYINGVKKTTLETGNVKFTASTGYVPKGSSMIAAIYRHTENRVVLHNFGICTEVSQNTYDFELGNTDFKTGETYTVEFFYWDGLKKITPIEVFDTVYEEIYVSTVGNDATGDGTSLNPYATLQRALTRVDEINEYQWGDIIVNIAGGTYTLSETLVIDEKYSGKNGYEVIIRGEDGDQPLISGGKKLGGWSKASGGIWRAYLPDFEYVRNLYINGYPAVMARSERHYNTAIKKDGYVPTTVHKETNTELENISLTAAATGIQEETTELWSGKGFAFQREELEKDIANPIGMELVWPYTFEAHITPVINFTKTADEVMFFVNADLLKRRESSAFNTGVSFYFQNAKEFLDKPGEFFYDKANSYIYYYPYEYENMLYADAYVGNVEGMVKVAGSSLGSKVQNVTIENLQFSYGANNFINKYGYIGSQTDGVLVPFEWSEGNIQYLAQFAVDNADNINIKDCEFSCLGSAGISMIHSVSNSSIEGNIIRDIAGTGIRIGHPTHNRQRDGVEVCSNIDVTNNVIRRIAGETFNNCAITVYYEKFINILHNDIENVPYSGMSIGWGWGGGAPYDCSDIDVSYNKVQNVMNTLHDGGGIYTLGPLKNSKISNNYLKEHNSRSGGMIYNDQGSSLLEVFNNVILDSVYSQAITMANDKNSSTKDLTYYSNYSDAGTRPKIADGKGISFEEHIIVKGEGETLDNESAKNIYRNAGLESEYISLLSKPGVELPLAGRTISSELPEPAPSDVISMSAAEFDLATSTNNLEMITYADGIGVALNYGESVNYKLDIPKAGYYRIIFRAMGDSSADDGIKISGDAKDITMRVYNGTTGGVSKQLAITDSTFYDYRICTAYFDAGVKNLTASVATSGERVILKEVHYANLLKDVKASGVNIIPLRAYYKVSGLTTNTYENYQSGYPSEGAQYYVSGAVTNGGNKTTTLTYKLNVAEAGTYKVTAASWVGANSPVTYQILLDGEVKSTGTTKTYSSLKKSEDTVMSDLVLPAGEVELTFKATSNGSNYSIMYYFTLERK